MINAAPGALLGSHGNWFTPVELGLNHLGDSLHFDDKKADDEDNQTNGEQAHKACHHRYPGSIGCARLIPIRLICYRNVRLLVCALIVQGGVHEGCLRSRCGQVGSHV